LDYVKGDFMVCSVRMRNEGTTNKAIANGLPRELIRCRLRH
jgi:hypothetical protein